MRYTYDRSDKWKLLEIRGSDGVGNPDRVLTLQYIAGTHLVSSVNDGIRTWSYNYLADGKMLSTVTLPDQSMWRFDGMAGTDPYYSPGLVFLQIGYGAPTPDTPIDMECDAMPGEMNNYPGVGTMLHPSGALGTFKVEPVRHARNGIPRTCYNDDYSQSPRAYYAQYIDTFALTEKSIEGPGLQKMTWTTR